MTKQQTNKSKFRCKDGQKDGTHPSNSSTKSVQSPKEDLREAQFHMPKKTKEDLCRQLLSELMISTPSLLSKETMEPSIVFPSYTSTQMTNCATQLQRTGSTTEAVLDAFQRRTLPHSKIEPLGSFTAEHAMIMTILHIYLLKVLNIQDSS